MSQKLKRRKYVHDDARDIHGGKRRQAWCMRIRSVPVRGFTSIHTKYLLGSCLFSLSTLTKTLDRTQFLYDLDTD